MDRSLRAGLLVLSVTISACGITGTASDSGGGGSGGRGGGGAAGSRATTGSGGRPATGGAGNPSSGGAGGGSGGRVLGSSGGSGGSGGSAGAGNAGGASQSGGNNGGTGGAATGSGGVANGTGGGVGTGGSNLSCARNPPAPASGGASFPYPQHRPSAMCLYPQRCADADVTVAWEKYKMRLVVDGGGGSLRVQRPENQNDTVSEGIGYGMLFAVYLNDKVTFDKLWQYAGMHLDGPGGLMNWLIRSDGSTAGSNSATDGDEDMGFALVMADRQWGGYGTVAKSFLAKLAMADFQADGTVRGGDNFDDVNPSYLAPAFYKVFASYTGDRKWTTIVDKSYAILAGAANATTGLVPDWSSGPRGGDYTYDAARTPYRIALDACWFGEPRARAFSEKIATFFAGVGAANIKDGYRLDGGVIGPNTNTTFIGPAGVSGMAGNRQMLVDDAYTIVADTARAGTDSYYNLSWALFGALMMTGNFVELGAP